MRGVVIAVLLAGGAGAQEDPRPLVEALGADRVEDRDLAVGRLQLLGDRAIPALREASRSSDSEVRLLSERLLRETPSALIEDLRTDDIPGNARRARNSLVRRYNPEVKARLLEAVKSDDLQQAVQSGFVLAVRGDAKAALQADSTLFARAVGVFVRGDADGFRWVSAHLLLRLEQAASAAETDAAYRKILSGIPPACLETDVLEMASMCRTLGRPLPAPLLRRYLINLKDDTREENACRARRAVQSLKELALPVLEEVLAWPDAQARRIAVGLLLELEVQKLPPTAMATLGERIGRDPRALPRLLSFGAEAVRVLEERIESPDPPTALAAARGLVELDHARWAGRAVRVAATNLETDNFAGNAKDAAELLVRLGEDARPALRKALDSDDDQVVLAAASVLAATGQAPAPNGRLAEAAEVLARRTWTRDEPGCLHQALATVPGLKDVVLARLRKSGADGKKRADALAELDTKPWLSTDALLPHVAEGR